MKNGYISLHRKIQDNPIWQSKPFSKGQAWISLLLKASHKENSFLLGNELITCARGQFITSELKLMNEWGWSKSKTRAFLNLIQEMKMIDKKTDQKKTTLTICNYDTYQDYKTTKEPQKNHEETTKEPQKDTINKENKVNNENNENIKLIVDFLNQNIGTAFRESSEKTKSLIKARLREGFTVQDFETVIIKKRDDWMNDAKMRTFLRPETLFGTKFESYFNETKIKKTKSQELWDAA